LCQARDLGGDELELMVDAWMGWDVDHTLRMADLMAPFNVTWIEEPLIPDDYKGYERLCRSVTTTQIAHGEHEFSEHGLRELIDRRAAHILQPDFTWCGGLTPVLRIQDEAQAAGIPIIPHRGGEVWAYHWISAQPHPPLAEVVIGDGEFPGGDPPLVGAPQIVDGCVMGADRPGFGVSLDRSRIPAPKRLE
jgi:L-rhamnonate dehydratase